MAKTIDDIHNIFGTILPNWELKPTPEISNEEMRRIGDNYGAPNFNILQTPDSEEIVVVFASTTITGTGRSKPQIRLFTEKIIMAYKYSKLKHLRFFCLVLCTSDISMLKFPASIKPDDYIISLESNFDVCSGLRPDLRSMYEQLANHNSQDFFRLLKSDHNCTVLDQAAFIRISNGNDSINPTELEKYLIHFDNRPYMLSVQEGTNVVYQPSAMFENAYQHDSRYPWNLLVFGAPGTGKSFLINDKVRHWKSELGNEQVVEERITFFEDYTYHQFVGSYMPIPKVDVEETVDIHEGDRAFTGTIKSEHITYRFVPGPFSSILARAFCSKLGGEQTKHVLIIEELNRANAASIFGDIFQLLDRINGVSRYEISLPDPFVDYLFQAIIAEARKSSLINTSQITIESFRKIRIPDNLYIWATMNSADQGVFPLDSAFKRRWSFLYKDINDISPDEANRPSICLPDCEDGVNVQAQDFDWNTFRKEINKIILDTGLDEDRCVGYWFFSEEEMDAIKEYTWCSVKAYNGEPDAGKELHGMSNPLVDKLFSYLRQDVFRNVPTRFFKDEYKTLSSIRRGMKFFERDGKKPVCLTDITTLTRDAFIPIMPIPPEETT